MTAKAKRAAHLDSLAMGWRSREPRAQVGPMRVSFRLPWPPSANHCFVERVAKSKSGKMIVMKHPSSETMAYRKEVGIEVLRQAVPRYQLVGKMSINVMACPPDWRTRDLSNLWKQLEDALMCAAVVCDDGDFDDLRIYRGPIVTDGMLHVEIVELPGPTETFELPLLEKRRGALDEALELMGAS